MLVALFASRNWNAVTLNLWGEPPGRHQAAAAAADRLPDRLPADLADHARADLGVSAGGWKRWSGSQRRSAPPSRSAPTRRSRSCEARSSSPSIRPMSTARAAIARAVRGIAGGREARPRILLRQRPGTACCEWPSLGYRSSSTSSCTTFPNTVAKAVAGARADLQPAMLTVHAAGGRR